MEDGTSQMDASIQKYQAFLETVRCGNITAAAASLSYSQSGVSRMIADLEREWGLCLLERGHKGVTLTSDGEQVLPFVEALCEDHRRLRERVAEVKGAEAGTLVIGTFSSVATHVLPPMIQSFEQSHPNIRFELRMGDYSQIEQWVVDGRVDLGFLPFPPARPRPGLEHRSVLEDELLAVMPAAHPLARRKTARLEQLAAEPFILLGQGRDDEVTPLFEAAGVSMMPRFSTWDDYAIMSMVESGLGVAILPRLILTRCPYQIESRPLRPRVRREICAVYRPGLLSSAASAFLGTIASPSA